MSIADRAHLSERLHIAEQLIESVQREPTNETKGTGMSLNSEYEPERKPMFGAIKRAVLGQTEPKINAAPKAVERGVETPHQKVFRLVRERRIEDAAAIAARLINAGRGQEFFVYPGSPQYRRALAWYDGERNMVRNGQVVPSVETITPEMAQVLLIHNDDNRTVNAKNLADAVHDILNGDWELNGETVVLSRDGILNDGQHRSYAALLTGTAIRTVFVAGVTRGSRRTINTGRARTVADHFRMEGEGDYIVCAAIAGLMFQIDRGRPGTKTEIKTYFSEHAAEVRAGSNAAGAAIRGLGPSITGASAVYLMRLGASANDITSFFKIVKENEATKKGDPARTLHRALFIDKPEKRPTKLEWVSITCHHFISWRQKKSVRNLLVNLPLPESI